MSIRRFLAFTVLCLGLAASAQTPLTIAAAADLRGTLEEVQGAFGKREPSARLQISYGASGSLAAQIQQGAPFDVFLAADLGFPEQVQRASLASGEGVFPYAIGRLVLWVRRDLGLDPAREGLAALSNPSIKRIALANARVAPYGRAAEAALGHAGLLETLRPKLVYGENIAQAAQYLQTGAADAGLVSFSQASAPALRSGGLVWAVPPEAYPPLRQGGVILKAARNVALARAFRAFLLGAEGQAILARHGFGKP